MRLSIIIPCYNMEAYLPTCLDSILNQGLDPASYEIIIVNDESRDQTLAIAREYENSHPNIKVIDKTNAGVGAARNSGLEMARGTYIYFLDPDDYLADNTIPKILEIAEKLSLDVLTFKSLPVSKDEIIPGSQYCNNEDKLTVYDGVSFIADRKFSNEIWWYIIRRDFMLTNNLRFIEGRWMEDAILTAQLFCKAARISHVDHDVHRYRILPTSAMRNKTPEHYRKVIYDNANAAHVFVNLIEHLPDDHPHVGACKKRLRTRQQSFVFFLLVRLMKSDISIEVIPEMLKGFERIGAYPLNNFLGEDYSGIRYSLLVFIYNRKYLIKPFMRLYRVYNKVFQTNSLPH
ncbi:glycosyltransferase [Zeaxanthinibacter enoshimensis]|uniref:Glycosyl transferase family 2 n=1 Tax=Zeaxanthinibacter enoshimensis TaxID=392009 RepID=A0A4R6TP74_9FLAO|nr:glycosyltransferase [Zeaxanthinibacter enoshimensis]TDQ31161.1 glycosyl transferase family 2 [Zeaxanthinibacter enoshimensis]